MSALAGLFRRIKRKILPPATKLEGYENPELVDVIFKKTLAYNAPKQEWRDVVGASTVLDFGGASGAHYKEAIHHTPDVRWAVVETPAMVTLYAAIPAGAEYVREVSVMRSSWQSRLWVLSACERPEQRAAIRSSGT